MTVQASSAYSTPEVFWRVHSTLRAAGCEEVVPYHVLVPTFGDWGFQLCAPEGEPLRVPPGAPPLRYASNEVLAAATVFGRDNQPRTLAPSTLDRPFIVEDMRRDTARRRGAPLVGGVTCGNDRAAGQRVAFFACTAYSKPWMNWSKQ